MAMTKTQTKYALRKKLFFAGAGQQKKIDKTMPKKTGKDFFLCCLINVPGDHQVNVSWGWSLTQEIVCCPFKTQFHTNHINNQDKDKDIEKDKYMDTHEDNETVE